VKNSDGVELLAVAASLQCTRMKGGRTAFEARMMLEAESTFAAAERAEKKEGTWRTEKCSY
jgi:hypothetical protein